MAAQVLRLDVAEARDADHWRWVLKDAQGAFLADHAVALDSAEPTYEALFNLPAYLRHYAAPDRRDADERRLLQEAGTRIGERVLGQAIGRALLRRARPNAVVRVAVPPGMERLLTLPLEVAHIEGAPLSRQGVGFVFETAGGQPAPAEPMGDRLRLLALFSLPPATSPLNLRRERQMLRRLVGRLTGASGLAVELRVLQYGVTRDSLRDVLVEGEGWDVVHFSGHGLPGSLLLEKPDGSHDPVGSDELAKLLRQAGGRLKLVTLSACLSAAASIEQTLAWLGVAEAAAPRRDAAPEEAAAAAMPKAAPTLARALVEALDCAVLAMRYPVEDEFATEMAAGLYEGLFAKGQALPRAAHLALEKALGGGAGKAAVSALSAAAPALFGARAADLTLVPPRRGAGLPPTDLAFFPREPERFVGRVAAVTRASAALALDSDRSGVLFHGMAGAGKSWCAVELAYHHASAGRFQHFVWHKAPEQGSDIALALRNVALDLERQVPGLAMVDKVERLDALRDWLPRLKETLEHAAILIVLDNLEGLLSEDGHWRDERWGLLMEALLTPGGLSRTVLTSRVRPQGLPASAEVVAVHALPRDEALLLVRELPNLRRLLDGAAPGLSPEGARDLVRRALRRVQGHPKLIELAEALAAEPGALAAQLDRAAAAEGGGGELDAFLRDGETRRGAEAFLASLRGWTGGVAGALPEAARTFFHFLCALEEGDRQGWIIGATWSDLCRRLGRPEPAPDTAAVLAPLEAAGLVERRAGGADADASDALIHPGVAEAGRAEAGPGLQAAVGAELAGWWRAVMDVSFENHDKGPGYGPLIVRAGLAAFPYLSRRAEWDTAGLMLERAWLIDSAPATAAAVLPLARRVAEATAGTARELANRTVLAKVLLGAGQVAEAEAALRAVVAQAARRGEFATASAASGDLANLLLRTGRTEAALRRAERKAAYTRRAGHGPWSRLADEVRRLQVLDSLGRHDEVLERVLELRERMRALPDPPGRDDGMINVWNVREATLDVGREAALGLGKWQQALDLGDEALRSKQARGAPAFGLARMRFNAYGPLLRLGRYGDARTLLLGCRRAFEEHNAAAELGAVLSALATLEDETGRPQEARRFGAMALRYDYVGAEPDSIAVSHFNLANYLHRIGDDRRMALAHRLAALFIRLTTGSGKAGRTLATLAGDLLGGGEPARAALPADYAALCAAVQQVEGVRFEQRMAGLSVDEASGDELLRLIIADARDIATGGGDHGDADQPQGGAGARQETEHPMSDDDDTARAARVAAARLAADLDPRLPEQVERALAEDPLGRAPERALDPISLGSLVVSLAALGWTIYRDIKKDRDAARGDRAARAAWLSVRLRQDGIEALRQPAGITEEQRARFIEVVAEEVVKTTPSP